MYAPIFDRLVANWLAKGLVPESDSAMIERLFRLDTELIIVNGFIAEHKPESFTALILDDFRLNLSYTHRYTVAKDFLVYERQDLLDENREPAIPPGLEVVAVRAGAASAAHEE